MILGALFAGFWAIAVVFLTIEFLIMAFRANKADEAETLFWDLLGWIIFPPIIAVYFLYLLIF